MLRAGLEPAEPWVVRRIESPSNWREGTRKDDLVRKSFTGVDEGVSVYQVESNVEEAEVAAALWVCQGASKASQNLLRIRLSDLLSAGIDAETTEGTTGIRKVDAAHRDLRGSPEKFEILALALLRRAVSGEDLVRSVAGRGISARVAEFCALTLEEISSHSGRKARSELTRAKTFWPDSEGPID
jgi:hypothetical protein